MEYPGKELELFDKASFWRNYVYLCIKKYLGKKILEVGAGIGSFTKLYLNNANKVVLSEIDNNNYNAIKEKFRNQNKIEITNSLTKNISKKFDTILYISVLEHIEDDKKEIIDALEKLEKKGNLIICVPAYNHMYSNFDREIGHFRRYEKSFFKSLNLDNAKLKKLCFIDSCGYILYNLNKLFFKKETYPTKSKIFIWDKIFLPITLIIDLIFFYKIGKNLICVIEKK